MHPPQYAMRVCGMKENVELLFPWNSICNLGNFHFFPDYLRRQRSQRSNKVDSLQAKVLAKGNLAEHETTSQQNAISFTQRITITQYANFQARSIQFVQLSKLLFNTKPSCSVSHGIVITAESDCNTSSTLHSDQQPDANSHSQCYPVILA